MHASHLYLSPSPMLPSEETFIIQNYVDEDDKRVIPLSIMQGDSVIWLDEDQVAQLKAFL